MDQHIATSDTSHKDLVRECNDAITHLTDFIDKRKDYDSTHEKLTEWFPKTESDLQQIQNLPWVATPADIEGQLGKIKDINSDVLKYGQTLDSLKKVGEDLITSLGHMDGDNTQQIHDIQENVIDSETRYGRLRGSVEDKQQALQARAMESKDVQHSVDSILDWAHDTEALFDVQKPVSLHQETLKKQVQANRVMTADILNHKANIESLNAQAQGVAGTRGKIDEINQKVGQLEARAKQRGDDLQSTLNKVDSLYDNINQLDTWLIAAVKTIDPDGQSGERKPLKEKIEDLYKTKQSKQQDLDAIKMSGKDMLDEPDKSDKSRLREVLSNVQSKWHNLNELLVQMITMSVSTRFYWLFVSVLCLLYFL